jgi:hypothetical protein
MSATNKYNVLLVASHHGFFLTLKSLDKFKKSIDKIVVVIPDEKVEKYKTMPGEIFTNFVEMVKNETKSFKKSAKVYTAKFDVFRRVSQTASLLEEIKATGIWFQISAGAVLVKLPTQKTFDELSNNFLMMSSSRCYEEVKHLNMYEMLGQPALQNHEKQYTGSFLINADMLPEIVLPDNFMIKDAIVRGKFKKANPHSFSNREELVEFAFTGKQLLDHAHSASTALVVDYWSMIMQPKLPVDFLYGYPFEFYLPYIEQCRGLIPDITIDRIAANATDAQFSLEFRKALS